MAKEQLSLCQRNLLLSGARIAKEPNILKNTIRYQEVKVLFQRVEADIQTLEAQLIIDTKAQMDAKQKLKRMYSHERLFGLTKAERKAQKLFNQQIKSL